MSTFEPRHSGFLAIWRWDEERRKFQIYCIRERYLMPPFDDHGWQTKIPGGKEEFVDQGNRLWTAIRETKEETGIDTNGIGAERVYTDPESLNEFRTFFLIKEDRCDFTGIMEEMFPTSRSLIKPLGWVDLDELLSKRRLKIHSSHLAPLQAIAARLEVLARSFPKPCAA